MAQVHYYRDIDGTLVDMSAYAPRLQWTAASKSEEGAVGSWTVTLDDPLGELDILGHRTWFVEDDESEDDDDIIFGGFTGAQTFARMDGDQRRKVGPAARVITVELYDANTWLSRIVMRGADCKRPRENDAERMAWLLSTAEAGLLADTSTFVDTTGPRAMDKVDLRGTYLGQIVGDCASASGKNYFVWFRKVSGVRTLTIWYGRDTLPDYPSPFYITNDRSAISQVEIEDGTANVWELSADAKMLRTPERQYCGNYLTYGDKGAATYRHNAATHAQIASYGSGHRDMTSSLPLVKTKAKAQARADRQLEDVADQDVRITTRLVNVPSTRVTLAKSGMRVQVEGTHWGPTCDDWHYARIVSAQPKPHGRGELYDIDLELVLGDESSGPPAPQQRTAGGVLWQPGNPGQSGNSEFQILWASTGDDPGAGYGGPERDAAAFDYLAAIPTVEGWTILAAEGSLDLLIRITMFDVALAPGPQPYTMELRRNGTMIDSVTNTRIASGGYASSFELDTVNVAVVAGDELTVYLVTNQSSGLVVPLGTGDGANRFQILDTSTVAV